MFCKVGMLPLSILARGIILHATVTIVLQECKMLPFVRFFHPNATSYNVSCHLESMLSLYVIFRLLYWHFSNCILTVILEMQIYPVNWFHSLVSLQICNICESYFYNEICLPYLFDVQAYMLVIFYVPFWSLFPPLQPKP